MPAQPRRPAKRKRRELFKIGEVAHLVGVSPSCLRNWESRGLLKASRTEGGYRLYSREVIRQAREIQRLRVSYRINIAGIQMQQTRGTEAISAHAPEQFIPDLPERLAALRQGKGLSLRDVAQRVGITPAFLSAIEGGRSLPSFAALKKLAEFYGATVLSFFNAENERRKLVRRKDRRILRSGPSVQMELLANEATLMEPHLMRIAPKAGSGGSYSHVGEELVYVLEGKLEIWLEEIERYVLEPGDSLYFKSTQVHRWSSLTDRECVVLWVNAPPSF